MMKKTPLKRGKKKLKSRSFKTTKQEIFKSQDNNEIWTFLYNLYNALPLWDRKCQSCGAILNREPRTYYFDHLIEKSKRPDLAMEKDNIFICCLTCHALKTDGHPTEVHRAAIEKAKEKFGG